MSVKIRRCLRILFVNFRCSRYQIVLKLKYLVKIIRKWQINCIIYKQNDYNENIED